MWLFVYIPIEQVHLLVKCCDLQGVPEAVLFERAGIGESFWHKDIVPLKAFVALVEASLELTGDEHLGIELGKQLNFMKHGTVGALAFASKTGAETLLAFVNHSQRANAPFLKIQQQSGSRDIRITLTPSHLVQSIEKFVIDTALSSSITMIRAMISGLADERLIKKAIKYFSVSYGAPSSVDALQRYNKSLIVPVKFNQPTCEIVFHGYVADIENPFFNSSIIEAMAKAIKPIPTDNGVSLVNKIEQLLIPYDFRFPAIDVIAVQLGLSERTLHRRLSESGTKYREICDSIRSEQAKKLIATEMPVDEIAYRLGYFDAASFYKAFKRWEGISPSGYRASLIRQ